MSSDDASLQRLLHQAVRNHLRSIGRRTDFGALVRRVRNVLEGDERFMLAGGTPRLWTLTTTRSRDPFTGQPETLVQAAWTVGDVKVVRWRSDTRRSPLADRDSISRICEGILETYPTAMTVAQLSRAIASRLNVAEPPLLVELDDALAKPIDDAFDDGPANRLLEGTSTRAVWERLSERERAVLTVLDLSVRDAADQLRLGKSQTGVAMKRIRTIIEEECVDEVNRGMVTRRLQDIADLYIRTDEYGGAY
jgi:hypothetical protein